jgi:diacyltrehalose acyltransferase
MPGVNGGRRRPEAVRARSGSRDALRRAPQTLLAGSFAVGLVAAGTVLGAGTASAEDSALVFGGAKRPGLPWAEITDKVGRGYYPEADRHIVDYPAGFVFGRWPDRFLPPGNPMSTPSVGESVDTGVRNLDAALATTNGHTDVLGLSEGSLVLSEALARLAHDPNAPSPQGVSFTLFAPPAGSTPFSHSIMTVFTPGTRIPLIDYTVRAPVDSQYDTTVVVGEYDLVSDFPDRPENVLALANALAGLEYVHTQTSYTSPADVPPEYIRTTVNSRGATQTVYFVPTRFVPLTLPLRDAGVPGEIVDQIDGVLRPIVDAGYSRNDYPGAPATGVDPVARANVEDWVQQVGKALPSAGLPLQQGPAAQPTIKLSRTDQENVDKAVRGIKVSPTDQANIDKAVQGVKLSPADQANMDNAAQQVKNLFPGLG